jgi:hypothetical protein
MLIWCATQSGEYELKFRTNQLEHSFGYPLQIGHQEKADKVSEAGGRSVLLAYRRTCSQLSAWFRSALQCPFGHPSFDSFQPLTLIQCQRRMSYQSWLLSCDAHPYPLLTPRSRTLTWPPSTCSLVT